MEARMIRHELKAWGEPLVARYHNPMLSAHLDADAIERLRAQAARDEQHWHGVKKQTRDPELGRFCRDQISEASRVAKAARFVAAWERGDEDSKPPCLWPVELDAELDRIVGVASL
jgi:hypothetical protein